MEQLEEIFQTVQIDEPTEAHGILQTKDYNDFIILSDIGDVIHRFTGAKLANKCLPGDHVSYITSDDGIGQCQLELRYEHSPIVGTLELTSKSTYGLTKRGYPMYLFTPYNKSYPPFIVGSSENDTSKNKIVLIQFDKWLSTFPRGLLIRTLGDSGEYKAEYEALIWQACPFTYPKYDYKPEQPKEQPKEQRRLVEGYTFNIDPKGCRDVDDVFTFMKVNDGWQVTITISDVASYVEDGSAIDIMSSLINQTLYSSDGEILRAMLPLEYERACSILPGKKSYGISLEFLWSNAKISNITWYESVLENNKTFSYEDYNSDFPLQEIASHLAKEPLGDSHKWVEQMMLFYNREAGSMLKRAKMGILRRHSAPDMHRLEEYKQHLPEFEYFAYSAAEYCLADDQNTRHYGLQSSAYTHATSPIRRYADLVNQRVLKLLIRQSDEHYIVPLTMYDMHLREKAIKSFARDADFLKAITSASVFSGIIMDKIINSGQMKIRIYVPLWKRMISTTYSIIDNNTVLSKDEQKEIDVHLYRTVKIKCAVMMQARNWKERIIIHIQ
jgi:exoribonuclease R